MSDREASGEARAWGWVAHLRGGGTTPWADWSAAAPDDAQAGRYLPGAQQLELLRRMNLRRVPQPALAERVLAASAPGRGRPDLGLVGVLPESRFGPPPVVPETLPPEELVRVATTLIAEDVVAAGEPAAVVRRPRRLRRRYRVLGDPELARPLRERLTADGRPPGGRSATVLVLGTDLETMLAHAWTSRCSTTGAAPWPAWLAAFVRRDALPPRVDLPALAEQWARRVGPGRVHVVLDPSAVPGLLRARGATPTAPVVAADAAELLRLTAPVLGTLVAPEQRARLMWQRLRPWVAGAPGAPVRVPERHRAWLQTAAADLRDRLAAGDYAVHGRAAATDERSAALTGPAGPDHERVLELAVRLLLDGPADEREGM